MVDYLRKILPHGFESFELTMWAYSKDIDFERFAKVVSDADPVFSRRWLQGI